MLYTVLLSSDTETDCAICHFLSQLLFLSTASSILMRSMVIVVCASPPPFPLVKASASSTLFPVLSSVFVCASRCINATVSSVRDLCRFDVVLTTYGVVSSERAKYETDIQARAISVSKGI